MAVAIRGRGPQRAVERRGTFGFGLWAVDRLSGLVDRRDQRPASGQTGLFRGCRHCLASGFVRRPRRFGYQHRASRTRHPDGGG
jgi:hypothetical protein